MIEPTRLADPSDGATFVPIPSSTNSEQKGRLEPGQLFGERYRIEAIVGRGGMGEVYQARDLRLHQTIALKLLHESASQNAQALGLFIDEVRIARQITHPNVCRVFDLGEVDGSFFLTMESIDGDDLASVLKWAGPIPQQRALDLALQICRGLDAVHQQGILHRDLKPANLLFDLDGVIHLTDFGLAGWVENDGSQGGTLPYMAPELFAGEPASLQSDLYALGVTLYELLSGEHPYAGKPLGAVRGEPIRLSDYVTVDPSFERAILRCLAEDPERRPSSVEVLINSLSPDIEGDRLRTVLHGRIPASQLERHDQILKDLLDQHGGLEVEHGDEFLLLFERPSPAVHFALAYQTTTARLADGSPPEDLLESARLAIHLGDVSILRPTAPTQGGPHLLRAEGPTVELARQLTQMAAPRQILLTEAAATLARRGHAADASEEHRGHLWMSHGAYRTQGSGTTLEIFEVGRPGLAPLHQPEDSPHGVRMEGNETILGWRPAPRLDIPHRAGWRLQRRVGEGGFGEVWLAQHSDRNRRRIFKFCYDRKRLHALKREIALVRHVNEALGERDDIARILDWNLEESPFFLETEYTAGGNLAEWAERQGGLDAVPIEQLRGFVVQVAEALTASHSVGVLHKDVKPENILITGSPGESPKIRLTDFGVGVLTDRDLLVDPGLTELRLTSVTEMASPLSAATRLYASPEILLGKPPTAQADVYALGVLLYQMEVGDFGRALATGWEHDIPDPLLRQDIADAVDGSPERRLASPRLLADRVRNLSRRRAEEQQRQRDAQAMQRARRRQRWSLALIAVGFVATVLLWIHQDRISQEKERAEREAAAAEQISQFLVDLFSTANPTVAQGTDITARQLLDQGAQRLEELDQQQDVRARLAHVMGTSYYALGLYEPAQRLLEQALEGQQRPGADTVETATILETLSQLHLDLGQLESAESLIREAVPLVEGDSDLSHPIRGSVYRHLGDVVMARGDEAEAGELYAAALEAQRRISEGQETIHVSNAMNSLATWHEFLGQYEEAEPLFREAYEISRRVNGPESRNNAIVLSNLASLTSNMGRDEEAEPLFREALRLHRKHLGNVHRDVAVTLNNLALVLDRQGRLAEAEVMYRETLEIKRQLYGDQHPSLAVSLSNLGLLMHNMKDYDAAIQLFHQALDIVQQGPGNSHLSSGIFLSHLARTQIAIADYAASQTSTEQALAALGDHFDAEHWRMAQLDSLRGEHLLKSGKLAKAEPLLRRSVLILEKQKSADSWYTLEAAARLEAFEAVEANGQSPPNS